MSHRRPPVRAVFTTAYQPFSHPASDEKTPRATCLPADTSMPNFEQNAVAPCNAQGFCTLHWHPYLPF